jgi:hypothetical protein
MGGIGAEIRQRAGVELRLADCASGQPGAALALETAVQARQESQRGRGQQLFLARQDAGDLDSAIALETGLRALLQHCRHRQLQNNTVGIRTIRLRVVFDKAVLSMRII